MRAAFRCDQCDRLFEGSPAKSDAQKPVNNPQANRLQWSSKKLALCEECFERDNVQLKIHYNQCQAVEGEVA